MNDVTLSTDAVTRLSVRMTTLDNKRYFFTIMMSPKTAAAYKPGWIVQKAKLRVNFPKLTDADLNFDESRKIEMFEKLEVKLGLTSKELQLIIDTW
jgi:hypothetical protein